MNSGWRWNIPLQNRCGNGYVYASDFIADDEACAELLASLYGEVLTDPRKLSFKTGIRKSSWNKNVFAIGLSSGFLEPLESTSIYLIQYSLTALYENFPAKQYNERLISKVNNIIKTHTENLRDFIILHYCLNERNGIPFWDYCRNMSLPDSLNNRIEEYMGTGHITLGAMDFFKMNSWLSMFSGFNRVPSRYHPKVSVFAYKEVERELANIKLAIAKAVSGINSHGEFMRKNDLFRTEGNN